MSRLPVGILICAGSVLFILGHWEGIPVAAAGMGLSVWMLAREHGGYVRGAARLAEDMDRLMPSGAGVDARRVAPRTVWWWTVAAVLLTISATGFFATIDRVHEEPLPTGFAMTAMAIGCGMWLERLLRVWGSGGASRSGSWRSWRRRSRSSRSPNGRRASPSSSSSGTASGRTPGCPAGRDPA